MYKPLILITLILILTSCTKEVFINEEPLDKDKGLPPYEFELIVTKVTDSEIVIEWSDATDPDNELVTYEVSLSDSIVATDLTEKYYSLEKLAPNTTYKVGVNAIDESYNKKTVTKNITTFDRVLKEYIQLDFGFYVPYRIFYVVQTDDKGFLISGVVLDDKRIQFVAKINENGSVEWAREYDYLGPDEGRDIVQLKDNNYLIIRDQSIIKIDKQGNPVWQYLNIHTTTGTTINTGYELNNGEIVIAGTTDIHFTPGKQLEAFITKLDAEGHEIWTQYYGTTKNNRGLKIIQQQNDQLALFGMASFYFQNGPSSDCYWLLKTNVDGEILCDTIYENRHEGSDVPIEIHALEDNSLLLCGHTAAAFDIYGLWSCKPRILKIDHQNNIEYDNYLEIPELSSAFFGAIIEFAQQETAFCAHGHEGFFIAEMNNSGEIISRLLLWDFPSSKCIIKNEDGEYVYITGEGGFLIINPNGYVE